MSGYEHGVGMTQSALMFWKFTLAVVREGREGRKNASREVRWETPAVVQMRGWGLDWG